ncbi:MULTISPECIES: hypothetical protein [unclassified Undibacterium]|uniref:hypothetical protein n=1 Tax=unclassified Undibacterium TaxID=2630295 RepID=UPI002AC8EA9C|nr:MULTISPECIES: hypothetical protein [unclassified Undibacterium]MEB0139209.1 hypothetical protein [Undibacterium sp. CCC2.1]MEB0172216.1 hypothetical protein [Undibacterium sp. CCC1.1]MEB0175927.1 hypothetical protein [Undibacterium sp. CCC3.4]MEB0215213.1 hypothetical protein [Undibacterium sp. 5I2]WPX43512.1 hypothetical protein RHM61_19425 [Undibacterium sp. CCC3.4]
MATVTTKKQDPAAAPAVVVPSAAVAPAAALKKAAAPARKKPLATKPVAKLVAKSALKPTAAAKPQSKPATPSKPAQKPLSVRAVAKPAPAALEKPRKAKLVRDSFTMPEAEYAVLGLVKKACLKAGVEVKKSQLLRIGLALLHATEVATLKKMIAELAPLKAGRPKKEK